MVLVGGQAEQLVHGDHAVALVLGGLHQPVHALAVLGGALEGVHPAGGQLAGDTARLDAAARHGPVGDAQVALRFQVGVGAGVVLAQPAVHAEEVGLVLHAQRVVQRDALLPDLLHHHGVHVLVDLGKVAVTAVFDLKAQLEQALAQHGVHALLHHVLPGGEQRELRAVLGGQLGEGGRALRAGALVQRDGDHLVVRERLLVDGQHVRPHGHRP